MADIGSGTKPLEAANHRVRKVTMGIATSVALVIVDGRNEGGERRVRRELGEGERQKDAKEKGKRVRREKKGSRRGG